MTALERLRISDAVLLLDLDGFKEVNDRHGRAAGDAVLADLGWLLRASMRGIDAVARYGGEEFVVVISQAPSRPVRSPTACSRTGARGRRAAPSA